MFRGLVRLTGIGLLFLFYLILGTFSAQAKDIAESEAVKAIYGESGPSYAERQAVAFALLNRGHLKGVYGLKSARGVMISPKDWQSCSRAWHTALNGLIPDPVKGADHWLSDWDLKNCRPSLIAWHKKMVETAYIVNTHFYKEVD